MWTPKDERPAWTAEHIEHLMNRAAFGARREDLERALDSTPEAWVELLMSRRVEREPADPILIRWEDFDLDPKGVPLPEAESKYRGLPRGEAMGIMSNLKRIDHRQFMVYLDEYFTSMRTGADPVNDRMTLFWHGFFTTGSPVVRRKYELIRQHEFLREHALGSFRDLLHGIVRDPGMLQYLDNNTNVKGHPNENLARELMELFSLGEGNYTELDVREAARALTGGHANALGQFEFQAAAHDSGEKTVLGVTGALRGAELVDILLAQEACPRWVAFRILSYFEGRPPSERRLARYAELLRESDYALRPFMRRLFLDPGFYRARLVGTRVQSPVDFLVGMCRKLDLTPAEFVCFRVTGELGECLYAPPSVKGWEGGESWVTNGLLMHRGNSVGVLLGTLPDPEPEALAGGGMSDGAGGERGSDLSQELSREQVQARARGDLIADLKFLAKTSAWQRDLNLAGSFRARGLRRDAGLARALLEDWLAIPPPAGLLDLVLRYLRRDRELLGLGARPLLECPQAEDVLRRLAHLIFSLPEAQLG